MMKNRSLVQFTSLLVAIAATGIAQAEVKMPEIFGDHMVLQEDSKLPVWGTAAPGEKVTVTFAGQTVSATAAADGTWRADLAPVQVSEQGQSMTIAGTNMITFQDVLVGEVWIASGQSNMQFGLTGDMHWHETSLSLDDPKLRLFVVPGNYKFDQQKDLLPLNATQLPGHWQVCTAQLFTDPKNHLDFSAVGYYFAKEIRAKTGKPVGMIGTYVGGTPAQSWTSLEGLKKEPALAHYIDERQKAVDDFPKLNADYPAKAAEFKAKQTEWFKTEEGVAFKTAMDQWNIDKDAAIASGSPQPKHPDAPKSYPSHGPTAPDGGNHVPSTLYNGMIAPLIPYAIRGAIWYQGESNGDNITMAAEYSIVFPNMIKDWRTNWHQGDFPFLFVLLANYRVPATTPSQDFWPWAREGQMKALDLPNTGAASAIDIGDEKTIHPLDKLDVGIRLSLAARATVYGEKNLASSGPIYDSMKVEGNKIRLTFKQLGGGLIMGTPPPSSGNPTPTAPTELKGFGIAGADQNFVWATAAIDGNDVVVSADSVAIPVAVRYDWADNPAGSLYNKANLPADPFRTDNWAPPPPPPPKPGQPNPAPAAPTVK